MSDVLLAGVGVTIMLLLLGVWDGLLVLGAVLLLGRLHERRR